jgi:hypothetical protein
VARRARADPDSSRPPAPAANEPRGVRAANVGGVWKRRSLYPAGITVAAVARQLGVSRSWASREANAAGTRYATSGVERIFILINR